MIRAINCCRDASCQEPTDVTQPFLPYDEPDLCNDYILKIQTTLIVFPINFRFHCVLKKVPSDTNLFDNVVLWKEVVQPTKKPRNVGPHKSKLEKTTSKKKKTLKKQERQECEYTDTRGA